MELLELTLPSPFENLALDEALLELSEQSELPREFLRVWESPTPMVVLGRSTCVRDEVNESACRAHQVAIVRRTSGGASVLAGRGCLMYAVILSCDSRPNLRMIDAAHEFVLRKFVDEFNSTGLSVARAGTSDLVVTGDQPLKFSGNSLRYRRRSILYHGTLLYDFPLPLISKCLKMPPRQPDYRGDRPHVRFLTNLEASSRQLRDALIRSWEPEGTLNEWPQGLTHELAEQKYRLASWTFAR